MINRSTFEACIKNGWSGPSSIWLLGLAAHIPLFVMYVTWVWQLEQYHYIPFLLLSVAWFAWSRWEGSLRYPTGRLTLSLFVGSFIVLLAGSISYSPWFASVSLALYLTSFLSAHGMGYLALPLVLLVRLPLNYDLQIITYLQALTTRLSSHVLDLLSVTHMTAGNVILLADRELLVAEACSGVQSAFTIAFIALFVVVYYRRRFALVPIYLAISLVWAVLCNLLRVTTIAYAAAKFDIDLSTGWVHDLLGYGTLLVAVVLTFSTDALLQVLFHEIGDSANWWNPFVAAWQGLFAKQRIDGAVNLSDAGTSPVTSSQASDPGRSVVKVSAWGVRHVWIGVLTLIMISAYVPLFARTVGEVDWRQTAGKMFVEPPRDLLDRVTGPVAFRYAESTRNSADPRLGINSDQWHVARGSLVGQLVISQPYPEWHELTFCYKGMGWDLQSTELLSPRSDIATEKVKLARMVRRDGALGYLIYTGVAQDGSIIVPPDDSLLRKTFYRCMQLATGRMDVGAEYGECAMLQGWFVSEFELSQEALQDLVDAVATARIQLVRAMGTESAVNGSGR
jgi:exosortase